MTIADDARNVAAQNVRRAWELFKIETDAAGKRGIDVHLVDTGFSVRRLSRPRRMALKISESQRGGRQR